MSFEKVKTRKSEMAPMKHFVTEDRVRQLRIDLVFFSVLDPSKKFHLMPWVPGSLKHITTLVMRGPSSNTTVTHSASRPLKNIKLGRKKWGGGVMI